MGYESNEASVVTNVTSDHLDLQGIHTLPELAEVKSTVARVDEAGRLGGPQRRRPARRGDRAPGPSHVALFSLVGGGLGDGPPARRRAAVAATSSATAGSSSSRHDGDDGTDRHDRRGRPHPDHASAGSPGTTSRTRWPRPARRAASASPSPRCATASPTSSPSSERSPGRLNLFRLGARIVIVDFAHNEAGVRAVLDVAEGIAGGAAGRAAPVTAIIGTAGDRPDDTLRGIGKIAGKRAQRVAIKETLKYLRGRSRESIVGEILAGVAAAGRSTADVPVYESETAALRASWPGTATAPRSPTRRGSSS